MLWKVAGEHCLTTKSIYLTFAVFQLKLSSMLQKWKFDGDLKKMYGSQKVLHVYNFHMSEGMCRNL